ncbi:MAG: hypothetical protein GEV08_03365 [Acidimicrobiia bacterium]|nr:hypothetical protein [Acidimicrobiia bacterium]
MFRSLFGVAVLALTGASATLSANPVAGGVLLALGAGATVAAARAAEGRAPEPALVTVPRRRPR